MERSILLFGAGYTLTRLAASLPRERMVLTSRRLEQVEAWRAHGYAAERVEAGAAADVQALLANQPGIRTVIDSVPPPRGLSSDALQALARERGAAFKEAGVRRVLSLSTTGVFGVEDGSVVTNDTPSAPKNPLAEARCAVEMGYAASGVGFTAVRIPAIYGPGRGIGLALKLGTMKLIDNGDRWTNRVHVEDLVAYLRAMIEAPSLPPVVCVGDTAPSLQRDVAAFYVEKFNLTPPGSISLDQARAAGLFTQLANQRIDSSATRALLGLTLRYPSYREGAGSEFEAEIDPLG